MKNRHPLGHAKSMAPATLHVTTSHTTAPCGVSGNSGATPSLPTGVRASGDLSDASSTADRPKLGDTPFKGRSARLSVR